MVKQSIQNLYLLVISNPKGSHLENHLISQTESLDNEYTQHARPHTIHIAKSGGYKIVDNWWSHYTCKCNIHQLLTISYPPLLAICN